jgi:hypothetical protein
MSAQPDLFSEREAVGLDVRMPAAKLWPARAVWTSYGGKHQPCGVCIMVVHERGVAAAPHPHAARWRRKGPNGDLLVCSAHKVEMEPADKEAERQFQANVAATAARKVRRK